MTQMVKHNVEPMRAMIRSKEGKMMAITMKMALAKIRSENLRMPRVRPDIPEGAWLPDAV